jgi:hypothetical protein
MTRAHRQVDGSLALKLGFGTVMGMSASARRHASSYGATAALKRVAADKYKAFEHRRRQAQIRARHLLDLMEEN